MSSFYTEEDAELDANIIVSTNFDPYALLYPGYDLISIDNSSIHSHLQQILDIGVITRQKKLISDLCSHQTVDNLTPENIENDNNPATIDDLRAPVNRRLPSQVIPLETLLEKEMKQLKKDIERDRIIMNGKLIVGAIQGINNIIELSSSLCSLALSELPDTHIFQDFPVDNFVKKCLLHASRTEAGGIALDSLTSLNPLRLALLPVSSIAPPLVVRFFSSIGSPSSHSTDCSRDIVPLEPIECLNCEISSQLVFKAMNFDDSHGDEVFSIPLLVSVVHKLCCPILKTQNRQISMNTSVDVKNYDLPIQDL